MSQFRKTGTYYVSQWGGDDLNAGTSPTLPKASISALPSSTAIAVVGSGTYNGAGGSASKTLEADGKVVIDFIGNAGFGAGTHKYTGLTLRNINFLVNAPNWRKCVIETPILASFFLTDPTTRGINDCSFLDTVEIVSVTIDRIRMYNNSFFGASVNSNGSGGNVRHIQIMQNCYFSKDTTLFLLQTAIDTALKDYSNNCINGPVSVGGVLYELKKDINGGTRPDANGAIPDISSIYANVYVDGNFTCDPMIIDEATRVVRPESDLLKRTNSISTVGGARAGKYVTFDDENFTISFTDVDEVSAGVYKIVAGQPFGKIRLTGQISEALMSLQKIDLRIPFFFDGDELGASVLNNNVPDAYNGLLSLDTLGDLPERLRFEIRTSRLTNPNRSTPSDWDNDSVGVSGQWYLMEYGQPLSFHVLGGVVYGNADKNAINPDTILPFFYRSIDILITLSNTREI
jgi:hypothetical protein